MESEEVREDEAKSVAMPPRTGDRLGWRVFLCTESAAQAWESFALIALTSAGVCDRTLRPNWVGGPFPARLLSFNPARPSTTRLAGEMPPLREGDRYFLGLRLRAQRTANPAVLPFVSCCP